MPTYAKTLTDVAKIVLRDLGQNGDVADIDTPAAGSKAQLLKDWMYDSIERVQDEFIWGELTTTSRHDPDPTAHNNGHFRYALPEDCVHFKGMRPIVDIDATQQYSSTVIHRSLNGQFVDHEFEDNFVLTRTDGLEMVYIKRSYNPAEWSPGLYRCVRSCWAMQAAMAVTGDPSVEENKTIAYERIIKPFAKYRASRQMRRGTGAFPHSNYSISRLP